jgi:3-hydroxybutyryl-CoA dehydrogenase
MTSATLSIGVIGGGTMGIGVAYAFAASGCPTTIVEPDEGRARTLHRMLVEVAGDGVKRGKIEPSEIEGIPARVHRVRSVEELPLRLDLIVESVPEREELKRTVLAQAEDRGPAVLATNTSALSIDDLGAQLERPEAFLGMHFFNPVWAIGVVELVRGAVTGEPALAAARAAVERIGKTSIVVRDVPGFATSRLDVAYALEAMRMVESGVASPADIDRGVELAYRHPMGPLRLTDVVGLDVRLDIARHLETEFGERFTPPDILVEKVAAGELGAKSGRGFYDWPEA